MVGFTAWAGVRLRVRFRAWTRVWFSLGFGLV